MDEETAQGKNAEKPEYVPVYQKNLAEAILIAKGEERTMAEFAQACGVSPATFSRIAHGKIEKPLDEKLIEKIYENSAESSWLSFDWLMKANGMVLKSGRTQESLKMEERREHNRLNQEAAQSLIMQKLFERGHTIGSILGTPLHDSDPLFKRGKIPCQPKVRMSVRVKGVEPLYWHISLPAFAGEEIKRDDNYGQNVLCDADLIISSYQDVFLRDHWEPEAFKDSKYSILLLNRDVYNAVLEKLENARFNSCFSLLLADLGSRTVSEHIFPQYNGQTGDSLF